MKPYINYELECNHIIQKIFSKDFDRFLEKYQDKISDQLLSSIKDNVNKMITCKDISKGFTKYLCPNCFETVTIDFFCKSRFCNSCGKVYVEG